MSWPSLRPKQFGPVQNRFGPKEGQDIKWFT